MDEVPRIFDLRERCIGAVLRFKQLTSTDPAFYLNSPNALVVIVQGEENCDKFRETAGELLEEWCPTVYRCHGIET